MRFGRTASVQCGSLQKSATITVFASGGSGQARVPLSLEPIRLEMINRVAAVIGPKMPFLEWMHSIPDLEMTDMTLDELRSDEQTVFLLPDSSTLDESRAYVNKIYKTIFETESEGWWTNHADWPQKMTVRMFHDWFDVELHSIVLDTTGEDFMVMDY